MPLQYCWLEKGNDWGQIYFVRKGKKLNERGYADAGLGYDFQKDAEQRFLWGDGSEGQGRIDFEIYSEEVNDMGHVSQVKSKIPVIMVRHKMTLVRLEITHVMICEEDLPGIRSRF